MLMSKWLEDEQDTVPLRCIDIHQLPTLRELRERCYWSYFELAAAARVQPRVVYWMEHGIAVSGRDAARILFVMSCRLGQILSLSSVYGVRVKLAQARDVET